MLHTLPSYRHKEAAYNHVFRLFCKFQYSGTEKHYYTAKACGWGDVHIQLQNLKRPYQVQFVCVYSQIDSSFP